MCDNYSHEYGYLCDSCFDELVDSGMYINIEDFMASMPQPDKKRAAIDYFRGIFEKREQY